ncbi:hypothetical protein [Acinetobacter sp. SCLZS86]|nr:hypothetical protein [Acinetobacter sp. SCLZS86]
MSRRHLQIAHIQVGEFLFHHIENSLSGLGAKLNNIDSLPCLNLL